MKSKLTQLLLVAAILCGTMCMSACQGLIDAIVGSTDNPTQPTPSTNPAAIVKATDLLADAQKEGATVVFWFTCENKEYCAVFKKVGDDYVLQNGVANTRGADTQSADFLTTDYQTKLMNVINQSSAGIAFMLLQEDIALMQMEINNATAALRQMTANPKTHVKAFAAMPAGSVATKYADQLDELFSKISIGGIPEELADCMALPKVSADGSSVTMTSVGELKVEAVATGQTVEETIKGTLDDYQAKVLADVSAGGGNFFPIVITIEPEILEMPVGDTKQLKATFEPSNASQDMSWISSDERVATVDSEGKVTAVATGMTTISARAKDGGAVGNCVVTVKDVTPPGGVDSREPFAKGGDPLAETSAIDVND